MSSLSLPSGPSGDVSLERAKPLTALAVIFIATVPGLAVAVAATDFAFRHAVCAAHVEAGNIALVTLVHALGATPCVEALLPPHAVVFPIVTALGAYKSAALDAIRAWVERTV